MTTERSRGALASYGSRRAVPISSLATNPEVGSHETTRLQPVEKTHIREISWRPTGLTSHAKSGPAIARSTARQRIERWPDRGCSVLRQREHEIGVRSMQAEGPRCPPVLTSRAQHAAGTREVHRRSCRASSRPRLRGARTSPRASAHAGRSRPGAACSIASRAGPAPAARSRRSPRLRSRPPSEAARAQASRPVRGRSRQTAPPPGSNGRKAEAARCRVRASPDGCVRLARRCW